MNEHETARRASALPAQFATRLDLRTLEGLQLMNEGGELMSLLVAALAGTRARVSAAEQSELRSLLEAMAMPTEPVQQLSVCPL